MNVLPLYQRMRILAMKYHGATHREIAASVGANRRTVASWIDRLLGRRHELSPLVLQIGAFLQERGIDPAECAPLLALARAMWFECPLHIDADPATTFENDGSCKLCRSAGGRRHHRRRKAEGRPIYPPWSSPKRRKPIDPSGPSR